jgi:hypothetical protein
MNRERIKEFLSHPLFISLIIWIVILIFIPDLFQRYRTKMVKTVATGALTRYYFSDIDNDGTSERFSIDLSDASQTKVMITRNEKVIDQFNFRYQATGWADFFAGDYNNDGIKECFLFTRSNDSIFLSVFDPVRLRKTIIDKGFVDDTYDSPKSTNRPYVVPVGMERVNGKPNIDFLFYITAGFSLRPRKVYLYSAETDSLIKSPLSAANITGCKPFDLNGDGFNEFILSTSASNNYHDYTPYSDSSSWLMVLDKRLQFMFPPVKFKGYPSRLNPIPLKIRGKCYLAIFHDYFGTEQINSSFYLYDIRGNKIKETDAGSYEISWSQIYSAPDPAEGKFYFLRNRDGEMDEVDPDLKVIAKSSIPPLESGFPIGLMDADSDGEKEYLFSGAGHNSVVILRQNFRYPVTFNTGGSQPVVCISEVLEPEKHKLVYLQYSEAGIFFQYSKNPFYYFKYPLYLLSYLLVFLFIRGMLGIQEYRLKLKSATEKKIASLQMKAIKNQIDPHFTLNILNAIGSLYSSEKDKEKADYVFSKYARLIRDTVISSDQVVISLSDELDFVKNYVDLERFRSNNSFSIEMTTGKEVDTSVKIPRMLIHSFVENAIKYGVRKRESGGILRITSQGMDKKIVITIEDNGPGIDAADNNHLGTGKGLSIVNEMTDLYFRLERARISYKLRNITHPDGTVAGTRAVIEIPCNPGKSV